MWLNMNSSYRLKLSRVIKCATVSYLYKRVKRNIFSCNCELTNNVPI